VRLLSSAGTAATKREYEGGVGCCGAFGYLVLNWTFLEERVKEKNHGDSWEGQMTTKNSDIKMANQDKIKGLRINRNPFI
jgi:hypothetical protein